MNDEQRIEQLARAIYSELHGHLDYKYFKAMRVSEILDWLSDGDIEGRSIEDLVEEWREYTAEANDAWERGEN